MSSLQLICTYIAICRNMPIRVCRELFLAAVSAGPPACAAAIFIVKSVLPVLQVGNRNRRRRIGGVAGDRIDDSLRKIVQLHIGSSGKG